MILSVTFIVLIVLTFLFFGLRRAGTTRSRLQQPDSTLLDATIPTGLEDCSLLSGEPLAWNDTALGESAEITKDVLGMSTAVTELSNTTESEIEVSTALDRSLKQRRMFKKAFRFISAAMAFQPRNRAEGNESEQDSVMNLATDTSTASCGANVCEVDGSSMVASERRARRSNGLSNAGAKPFGDGLSAYQKAFERNSSLSSNIMEVRRATADGSFALSVDGFVSRQPSFWDGALSDGAMMTPPPSNAAEVMHRPPDAPPREGLRERLFRLRKQLAEERANLSQPMPPSRMESSDPVLAEATIMKDDSAEQAESSPDAVMNKVGMWRERRGSTGSASKLASIKAAAAGRRRRCVPVPEVRVTNAAGDDEDEAVCGPPAGYGSQSNGIPPKFASDDCLSASCGGSGEKSPKGSSMHSVSSSEYRGNNGSMGSSADSPSPRISPVRALVNDTSRELESRMADDTLNATLLQAAATQQEPSELPEPQCSRGQSTQPFAALSALLEEASTGTTEPTQRHSPPRQSGFKHSSSLLSSSSAETAANNVSPADVITCNAETQTTTTLSKNPPPDRTEPPVPAAASVFLSPSLEHQRDTHSPMPWSTELPVHTVLMATPKPSNLKRAPLAMPASVTLPSARIDDVPEASLQTDRPGSIGEITPVMKASARRRVQTPKTVQFPDGSPTDTSTAPSGTHWHRSDKPATVRVHVRQSVVVHQFTAEIDSAARCGAGGTFMRYSPRRTRTRSIIGTPGSRSSRSSRLYWASPRSMRQLSTADGSRRLDLHHASVTGRPTDDAAGWSPWSNRRASGAASHSAAAVGSRLVDVDDATEGFGSRLRSADGGSLRLDLHKSPARQSLFASRRYRNDPATYRSSYAEVAIDQSCRITRKYFVAVFLARIREMRRLLGDSSLDLAARLGQCSVFLGMGVVVVNEGGGTDVPSVKTMSRSLSETTETTAERQAAVSEESGSVGRRGSDRSTKVVVDFVIRGGPAEHGGVKPGDTIVRLAGQRITSQESFRTVVFGTCRVGALLPVVLERLDFSFRNHVSRHTTGPLGSNGSLTQRLLQREEEAWTARGPAMSDLGRLGRVRSHPASARTSENSLSQRLDGAGDAESATLLTVSDGRGAGAPRALPRDRHVPWIDASAEDPFYGVDDGDESVASLLGPTRLACEPTTSLAPAVYVCRASLFVMSKSSEAVGLPCYFDATGAEKVFGEQRKRKSRREAEGQR